MAGLLNEEHEKILRDMKAQLNELDKHIADAERAGIDVAAEKAKASAMKVQIDKFLKVYFPSMTK